MHTLYFILLTTILFAQYGCQSQALPPNLEKEDKFCNCIVEKHQQLEIDYEKEMELVEKALIDQKVLRNYSPKAYYKALKYIHSNNSYPNFDYKNEKIKYWTYAIQQECGRIIKEDTSLYQPNSQMQKLVDELAEVLTSNEAPSLKNVASAYLEVLTPKDFQRTYWKTRMLLLLYFFNNSELRESPKICIQIKENNDLYIQDELSTLGEIPQAIQLFKKNLDPRLRPYA